MKLHVGPASHTLLSIDPQWGESHSRHSPFLAQGWPLHTWHRATFGIASQTEKKKKPITKKITLTKSNGSKGKQANANPKPRKPYPKKQNKTKNSPNYKNNLKNKNFHYAVSLPLETKQFPPSNQGGLWLTPTSVSELDPISPVSTIFVIPPPPIRSALNKLCFLLGNCGLLGSVWPTSKSWSYFCITNTIVLLNLNKM